MSAALNRLLHDIVSRLAHASEAAGLDLHAQVEGAVPLPDPDEPDAGPATPAAPTDKGKGPSA